jgi:hypothetical protein
MARDPKPVLTFSGWTELCCQVLARDSAQRGGSGSNVLVWLCRFQRVVEEVDRLYSDAAPGLGEHQITLMKRGLELQVDELKARIEAFPAVQDDRECQTSASKAS